MLSFCCKEYKFIKNCLLCFWDIYRSLPLGLQISIVLYLFLFICNIFTNSNNDSLLLCSGGSSSSTGGGSAGGGPPTSGGGGGGPTPTGGGPAPAYVNQRGPNGMDHLLNPVQPVDAQRLATVHSKLSQLVSDNYDSGNAGLSMNSPRLRGLVFTSIDRETMKQQIMVNHPNYMFRFTTSKHGVFGITSQVTHEILDLFKPN